MTTPSIPSIIHTKDRLRLALFGSLSLLLLAPFFSGCIDRGKPSPMIESFVFEYPPPTFSSRSRVDEAVKTERFSVAKAYNSVSMVYRPGPYKLDTYASNRWMVNPGDMVSDYLIRDLRGSGLFRGILSYRDYDDARFLMTGNVEEILETEDETGRRAVLSLTVTLLDTSRTGSQRLILQKKYHSSETIKDRSPEGFARAVSSCMAKLSSLIITDVYGVVQGNTR